MGNPPRLRKRVDAEPPTLKRGIDGSGFTQCDKCVKVIPVGVADMHDCALDSKIMTHLECHYTIDADERRQRSKKRKSTDGMEQKIHIEQGKKSKDPNQPKKPKTAFIIFQEEFRMQHKGSPDSEGHTEVWKQGIHKWKSMTLEEKEPYVSKATEQKLEYIMAMGTYLEKLMKANEEADSAEVGKVDLDVEVGDSKEGSETDEE